MSGVKDSWEEEAAQDDNLARQAQQQLNLGQQGQQGGFRPGGATFTPGAASFQPGAQTFTPGQTYGGQGFAPQYQQQQQYYGGQGYYPQYGGQQPPPPQQQQFSQYGQQQQYGGYNQGYGASEPNTELSTKAECELTDNPMYRKPIPGIPAAAGLPATTASAPRSTASSQGPDHREASCQRPSP